MLRYEPRSTNNPQTTIRSLRQRGISMVEFLVGVLIFSIMMTGVYTAFQAGNRSWSTYENNVALQRDARGAILVMVPELREASGVTITQSSGNTTISFSTDTLGAISYAWSNSGGSANKIIRTVGASTRTLASNISALSFTNLTTAILIDLTSTRTPTMGAAASFSLKEKVVLR